ncbi:O-methyltransferase [Mycena olivaceomarginata]|nr:O-methyltransferase [Mycena olivaceomarginata]
MATPSDLCLLGEIILNSIQIIERRFNNEQDPVDPTSKSEALLLDPEISTARSCIVAAASQLIAMVRSPVQTLVENGLVFHLPSCLRAAVESNMVEIIREAGNQGIHANEIAKRNNTDPVKAARILRLLANHHIFTELAPDVFCLNRLSSVLDSNQSVVELQENPYRRVNASGISSLILLQSSHLTEAFTHPDYAHSVKATDSPWNIAAQTDAFLFDCMNLEPPEAVLNGFKWHDLPQESLVVDLGGGIGSTTLIIAKAVPHLNFVVQDRPTVIQDAETYWAQAAPDLLHSGRVKLEVHNFFEPQPHRKTAVFLLRWVMHDWADPLAVQILQQLREAATPDTKLITADIILPYTCPDTSITRLIPGAALPPAPAPLPPNMGAMFVLGNCQERTLGHFVHVASQGGWKVAEVHHIPGSSLAQCVSVPM